jgi:hypothetical protein
MRKTSFGIAGVLAAGALLATAWTAQAGTKTWTFETDPLADGLDIFGGNKLQDTPFWRTEGGNTGGFLALTYPWDSDSGFVIFPDIDEGQFITAFTLKADIRSGNPAGDRAADGWAVSLARSNDPFLASRNSGTLAAGLPEAGTTTGIAISFDTWAGNTLPDGADIEGIIIRVDNVTVHRQALGTRNGLCDDAASLQTGPRDADFWAALTAAGVPADVAAVEKAAPNSWANLCWKPLEVTVDQQSRVTVKWKGATILNEFATQFFPSAGRIVLSGRTGGENSHVHFDNVNLTTTATAPDSVPPSNVASVTATEVGANRVVLTWTEATDDSGRVAYRVRRGNTIIADTLSALTYTDRGVFAGSTYNYSVTAIDVALNESAVPATVSVTTPAEVPTIGYLKAKIYRNLGGTVVYNDPGVADLLQSAKWPNGYDEIRYVRGTTFGDPGFGETFGDNYGIAIEGVLTPTQNGSYRFFTRSDDGSEFYINRSGTAIPDPLVFVAPDAVETGCCAAFEEVGAGANTAPPAALVGTFPTSEAIALTAGQSYGFLYLVKEGGGGDWGQLAWRLEGDSTPANQLQPIPNVLLSGVSDPVGTTINILQDPVSVTVIENEATQLSFAAQVVTPHVGGAWYQWYKNDQPVFNLRGAIRDTNLITVSLPVVKTADAGTYKVRIGASGVDNIYTATATLTVQPDTKRPEIVSAGQANDTFTRVTIRFSEPVTAPSATLASNYTLDQGATVSAAALSADGFTVTLTTSALAVDTLYALTVTSVADNAGNTVAAGTTATVQSWAIIPNRAKLLIWDGVNGAGLADMTNALNSPNFPTTPSREFYRSGLSFGEESSFGNTYGDNLMVMMQAWVQVPLTGPYRFFIRSDDASKLFIATTGDTTAFPDPRTATQIAVEAGCCAAFQAPGDARTSEIINLTAGTRYAVTYVVKEGGGGDWGQVALRHESDTTAPGNLQPIRQYAYYYGPKPAAVTGGIAFVSFHGGDDAPTTDARNAGFTRAPDVGYTDLLKAKGYDVTRIVTTGTPDVAALNQYDLVIISRSVPSGDYQDYLETYSWSSITKPTILLNGYILRNSRLGFTTGGTIPDTTNSIKLKVNDPAHPIFAGVSLDGNNVMVNDYAGIVTVGTTNVQRGISVNTDPVATGGTVLAVVGTEGDPAANGTIIAEWDAGATMANAAANVLAGPRLVLLTGSREQALTSQAAGIYDLTADGEKLFLNAVAYMGGGAPGQIVINPPEINPNSITVTWTGGGEAETAESINGPWTPTGNMTGTITITLPTGVGSGFLRINKAP